MALDESASSMPVLLSRFVRWLLDSGSHKAAHSDYTPTDEVIRRCSAVTETIVAISRNILTPLQICLAVQLHHAFGSRSLIDILHAHGFWCSYYEVRRFITSAAKSEVDRFQNGVYVPSGIVSVAIGGSLVQEVDDNVDVNTETIDGKDTFHSMARVLFQQQAAGTQHRSITIKHGRDKSFPLTAETESLMQPVHFEKPKMRPEPQRKENATGQLKTLQSAFTGSIYNTSWVILRSLARGIIPLPCDLAYIHCDPLLDRF